jgi:membrane-associated phospholipid phosphatase
MWVTKYNPVQIVIHFAKNFFSTRMNFIHLIAVLTILFMNKIEMQIETKMNLNIDFATYFHEFEGDFVYFIQHTFQNSVLTYVLTFFYIVVFPALMVTSIVIYTLQKNYKMLYATCYAIMMNYFIAIPFYLFFPVNEIWFVHPNIDFLIPSVFPTFETDYRPLSGLNNCFPSLHTSISVTMALLAVHSKNQVWKSITITCASIIVFSIFYLGIHWFIDMLGGVTLAMLATTVGVRLSQRTEPWRNVRLQPSFVRQKVSENG